MKAINPNSKLPRIVAAAFVGSMIWAGCAPGPGPTTRYAGEAGPLTVDREAIASAPIDQTNRRPDTNPHLRTGLWGFTFNHNPAMSGTYTVVEAPGLDRGFPPNYADSTTLLAYNPEVIHTAIAMAQPTPGDIIIEAAGAAPGEVPPLVHEVEAYMDELERKTLERFESPQEEQP